MDAHRSTVLLTGFGPFPGVPENATARLVGALSQAAHRRFAARFVADVLPVEWAAAPHRLSYLLEAYRPDVALHFGVSHEARGFAIERQGTNACAATPDAVGALPPLARLDPDGPPARTARLPVERLVARLATLGLPAYASDSAGAYLCNALLYHSLGVATTPGRSRLTGFIHVPAVLADSGGGTHAAAHGLDWDGALAGGLEIVAVCLEEIAAPARIG